MSVSPAINPTAQTSSRSARRRPARGADAAAQLAGQPSDELIVGVRVGRLVEVPQGSAPLVDFPGNTVGNAVAARAALRLATADAGREVALMFEEGSPRRPVIVGLLEPSAAVCVEQAGAAEAPLQTTVPALDPRQFTVEADGQRVAVTAEQQLVLRCGKASITLTKAGKIILRGAYLLSRSSGVNRIKGGSVQIN